MDARLCQYTLDNQVSACIGDFSGPDPHPRAMQSAADTFIVCAFAHFTDNTVFIPDRSRGMSRAGNPCLWSLLYVVF